MDDEVLWFSSILDRVSEVVICYLDCKSKPDWSIGRRKSLSEHPIKNISCLGIDESEVFDDTSWHNPVINKYGMQTSNKNNASGKYIENYDKLRKNLKTKLMDCCNVFTHNPWGEYGNEEHVQVYRVIKELQENLNFNLWFSNYCSNKSFNLMIRYIPAFNSEYVTLKTNKIIGHQIKNLYKRNKCWTWYDKWEWFNEESFIKDGTFDEEEKTYGNIFPLNMIKVKFPNESNRKSLNFSPHIKIKKNMKKIIKKIVRKFGIEISRYSPKLHEGEVVSLKPQNACHGNVLLSYIIEPFLLKDGEPVSNAHTHDWESLQIAKTFLDLGYAVDVIDYRNNIFIPKKDYSFFVAARTNFQRIAQLLNENCVKIVHLDTAHWLFNNSAVYRRCLDLQQRWGVTLKSFKWVEPNWAIECADYATVLGNEFTVSTYSYAQKTIIPLSVPAVTVYPWAKDKNYGDCRNHFLWFGSSGLVHKGLDLVLETFAKMPDYHLYVCGPIQEEKDFEKAYYEELYQTPNIHTVGWVDISSSEFVEITNKCIGLIYPSCSEGQSGAVVTCLQAGLIPILSYESGVDVDTFGVILEDCSIDEIKISVQKVSNLPAEELKRMSRKAWEYARANHTRESFAKEYRRVVDKIMPARYSENEPGENKEALGLST